MARPGVQQGGYGVLEMIMYVALFIVFSIVAISVLIAVGKSFAHARDLRKINSAAEAALERMVREIRLADSVVTASADNLSLTSIDPFSGSAQTVAFARVASAKKITVTKGSGSPADLTPSGLVDSLSFTKLTTPKSTAVYIQMTVKGVAFEDAAVLRRSYQ